MSDEPVIACVDKCTCEQLSDADKQKLLEEVEASSQSAEDALNDSMPPEIPIKQKIERFMKLGAY